jgi:hypothetical protein
MSIIITRELIDDLNTRFPAKIPKKRDVTLSEINRMQGSREVIDYMESRLHSQDPTQELLHVSRRR